MEITLGLDIGGTKLMVAAAGPDGEILRRERRSTPSELNLGLDTLHDMVCHVMENDTPVGIGAACGGPLDWRTGVISPLHQPQWRQVPLGPLFSQRYQCPVRVEVDTDAAALAERAFGKDPSARLLYLTLSTGMGGGFLVDGAIYRGHDGAHPEAAHQAIPYIYSGSNPVQCSCGNNDCLEALVSGNAIRRLYNCPAEELRPQQWDEVATNLGQGLRNLATLYAPQVIVLGGGLALGGGEPFLAQASQVMSNHLKLVPAPMVRFSRLGYDTALLGAVALGRQATGRG